MEDLRILKGRDKNAKPSRIQIALHRLNSYKTLEGKAEALKRVADPSSDIRSSVALALGTHPFEGEIIDAAKVLIHDSELKVRLAVYEGIGRSLGVASEPSRKQFLRQQLSDPALPENESLAARFALYRVSTDATEKKEQIEFLISKTKSKSNETSSQAIGFLIRLNSNERPVVEALTDILTRKKSPPHLVPSLYRALANANPVFIQKRLITDIRSSDSDLQRSALSVIPQLCPSDRWIGVRSVLSREKTDFSIKLLALAIARQLGGDKARHVISETLLSKKSKIEPELEKHAREALSAISSGIDACEKKDAARPHKRPTQSNLKKTK